MADSPVETELKLTVADRDALDAIVAALGDELEPRRQDNLYFDAEDGSLSAAGFAVRLREESGRFRLTVKSKGTDDGDFVARGEWETELDPDAADDVRRGGAPLGKAVDFVFAVHDASTPTALQGAALVPIGSMQNLRRRVALPGFDDLVVEADETTYPNGDVRHEVELEVPDASKATAAVVALREVFDRVGVAWSPSRVTKRERLERVLRGESA